MKENQLDLEGNEILINNDTLLKEDLIQTLKNSVLKLDIRHLIVL